MRTFCARIWSAPPAVAACVYGSLTNTEIVFRGIGAGAVVDWGLRDRDGLHSPRNRSTVHAVRPPGASHRGTAPRDQRQLSAHIRLDRPSLLGADPFSRGIRKAASGTGGITVNTSPLSTAAEFNGVRSNGAGTVCGRGQRRH